ncbi:hypothetical protein LTR56_017946 [Elasticomyces elasticus]|nr:hypothetical protein LTR56_017946 [Elasticomyces elasticus]KAK3647203.1 hypothetical protein LTR22_013864 [Elasticomyces elasticus]KAK4913819.1 hypothetical protein LTR49_017855 [Elasticomyces elasticus]KAK5752902.1 hypothetical protein LTS12_016974 [Elasticomyces elasticus]
MASKRRTKSKRHAKAKKKAAPGPSRFLTLPKEIRLIVYDILFEPLIVRPNNFDIYVLYSEWPKVSTGIISKVAQVCKQINNEAKAHLETQYLPKLMLFFDNVVDVYDLNKQVARLPASYQNIKICMYDIPSGWLDEVFRGNEFQDVGNWLDAQIAVGLEVNRLMEEQPGVHRSVRAFTPESPLLGLAISKRRMRNKIFDVLRFPQGGSAVNISVHQVCGLYVTAYSCITARLADLDLDFFEKQGRPREALSIFRKNEKVVKATIDAMDLRSAFDAMEQPTELRTQRIGAVSDS